MATLILGTVGRVFAGPIGGIVGTAVGSLVDSRIFGGGRAREQGRVSNPAVQSATYGEPMPIIVGRMRTAGNLIWSSGIREQAATSGGGKRGGSTTTYSYTASFAVGLVARRIAGIGRIWADGKMIRDEGAFVRPLTMRLHDGGGDQLVDPLIAAAEGAGGTPAYRGLAYAVFEDMPLADYGNRIPNLTFEIVADEAAIDAGGAIAGLAAAAGYGIAISGRFPQLSGHIAGRAGSLADALAPLIGIADASLVSGWAGMEVAGSGLAAAQIPTDAGDAHRPGDRRPPERRRRVAADTVPGCLELSFYDMTRDYQPGLQRVRHSAAATTDQRAVSAAMSPAEAKTLAMQLLIARQAGRSRQTLRLSWRHVGVVPGMAISLAPFPEVWRVRETRFENFILHLDLERVATPLAAPIVAVTSADGGRALMFDDQPAGPTTLVVLDLPPLPGELPASPRLWIAASGAGAGWRRAGVAVSIDGGGSFETAGVVEGGSIIGTTTTALRGSTCSGWDRFGAVEVELLSDRDWLEGRSADAVLAGGNLALVGTELFQFMAADAIGPRRFRLSGLLRGRRGTEAAVNGHGIGERFVLVEPARMLAIDPPAEMIGRDVQIHAVGDGDGDAESVSYRVAGGALRPLAPVRVAARRTGGDVVVEWVRRSRAGFGWIDFVDAPLAETAEAYAVAVRLDGRLVREEIVSVPCFNYSRAQRAADGGGRMLKISVAQISAAIGPGASASISVDMQTMEAV